MVVWCELQYSMRLTGGEARWGTLILYDSICNILILRVRSRSPATKPLILTFEKLLLGPKPEFQTVYFHFILG